MSALSCEYNCVQLTYRFYGRLDDKTKNGELLDASKIAHYDYESIDKVRRIPSWMG